MWSSANIWRLSLFHYELADVKLIPLSIFNFVALPVQINFLAISIKALLHSSYFCCIYYVSLNICLKFYFMHWNFAFISHFAVVHFLFAYAIRLVLINWQTRSRSQVKMPSHRCISACLDTRTSICSYIFEFLFS